MPDRLRISCFVPPRSWNGAATSCRGLGRALAARGHRLTFYEPDAGDRQRHRGRLGPPWARSVVWDPTSPGALERCLEAAARDELVVKASGLGVDDAALEAALPALRRPGNRIAFWDADASATLDRAERDAGDPWRALAGRYDLVFTYGGGTTVVRRYLALGARACVPIHDALDPTTHHPVPPDPRFACDLAFLGHRLPDREARVEAFFLDAAARLPERRFLLAGAGWAGKHLPPNVRDLGHLGPRDHNAFHRTPLAVLDLSREGLAASGHSPTTRLFEAAGAGACLVTDAWEGLEAFLAPGDEVLVARDGAEVADVVATLDPLRARRIGDAARRRVLAEHTYARRAEVVEAALGVSSRTEAALQAQGEHV